MFKNITVAAVGVMFALSAVNAKAESWFQFEAGLGITSAEKAGDGMFYSSGFSHSTPNGSYGARVGMAFNAIPAQPRSFVPGLRFWLAYENWGKVRWSSINPQDAADFPGNSGGYNVTTKRCNDSNCGTFRRFDSTGGLQSLSLTAEAFWDLGNSWQIGLEAGPALYKSTWVSVATALSDGPFGPAGTQEVLTHAPRLQVGVLVGAFVSSGPFAVRMNYLHAPIGAWQGKNVPAGIKGEWMLSANYMW